jgi:GAF domain-containing protein
MASWVDDGTSTYTVGDSAGRGFVGHEVLRRTGVSSLIVLPLTVAGDRLGLLVVADRANRRPAPEDIELLELLALQVATGLRMASALTELRERVARDALPGLQASLLPLPDPVRPTIPQRTTSR